LPEREKEEDLLSFKEKERKKRKPKEKKVRSLYFSGEKNSPLKRKGTVRSEEKIFHLLLGEKKGGGDALT